MNCYNEIKEQLINNEVYNKVQDYSNNRIDLNTYYNVGKLIVEVDGGEKRTNYGDGLLKEYSTKLSIELSKKFTITLLKNISQFYLIFQKGPTMSDQLTWSHYVELLKFNNANKINYYINISVKLNLSVRELRIKIKNNEYENLDKETKNKLINNENNYINDFIKTPILIRNNNNYSEISEKILKRLSLEDLDNFLIELVEGFTYIKNECKIKIGNRYNYIDLLLYNINYNCYVVIELKVTELKAEYIDQIQKYMNYIDRHIKMINHDKTIGIIICKKDNEFVMEYASDDRIFKTIYKINS